jgi:hypothetical protein
VFGNIRQGWKCPAVTNTLAYITAFLFTTVQMFKSTCGRSYKTFFVVTDSILLEKVGTLVLFYNITDKTIPIMQKFTNTY